MNLINHDAIVICAAKVFVRAHEDVYRQWKRRPPEDVPSPTFMALCEAVVNARETGTPLPPVCGDGDSRTESALLSSLLCAE